MPRFSSPVDNMVLHNVEWWWVIIKILQNFAEYTKINNLQNMQKSIGPCSYGFSDPFGFCKIYVAPGKWGKYFFEIFLKFF